MSKYEKLWSYIKNCNGGMLTLAFAEIGEIADVPIDHSFLRYKKELVEYGWEISMKAQTVLFIKAKSPCTAGRCPLSQSRWIWESITM